IPTCRAGQGGGKRCRGRAGVGQSQAAVHEVESGNAKSRDAGNVAAGASRQRNDVGDGTAGSGDELELLRLRHARQEGVGALVGGGRRGNAKVDGGAVDGQRGAHVGRGRRHAGRVGEVHLVDDLAGGDATVEHRGRLSADGELATCRSAGHLQSGQG